MEEMPDKAHDAVGMADWLDGPAQRHLDDEVKAESSAVDPWDSAIGLASAEDAQHAGGTPIDPGDHEPRFGGRLREYYVSLGGGTMYKGELLTEELDLIADAIDRDADAFHGALTEQRELLLQVEEVVQELRYAIGAPGSSMGRDVLDAEAFLARLPRIFGARPAAQARPRIVCLCGSTRFFETFQEVSLTETVAGRIVLSIGCNLRSDHQLWADPDEREAIKRRLDELHLRKIDLADEVLVLNVGGYIGESTSREIAYAKTAGKPVRYLEPQPFVALELTRLDSGLRTRARRAGR